MCEEWGGLSESEIFEREVDEGEQGLYTDTEKDGAAFRKETFLVRAEMAVRTSGGESVCGDVVEAKHVLAITNKTRLTVREEEVEE